MRHLDVVGLVAGREIRVRLQGRAWYVSTILVVVGIIAIGLIVRLTSDSGQSTADVGIAVETPTGFEPSLSAASDAVDLSVRVERYPSADAARQAVDDGSVDAVLIGSGDQPPTVIHADAVDPTLQAALQSAWASSATRDALTGAGLEPDAADDVLTGAALLAEVDGDEEDDDAAGRLIGVLAGVALFIALQVYGAYILMGVVEEKASAVIEVLLARIRAIHLLAGKVAGIGLLALAQLTIAVGAALVALAMSDANVPSSAWTALPAMIVWFLGGFVMYSFLYAMAGSMVSRQEDAQAASMPVTILLLIVYMSVFLLVSDPDQTVARVLSVIPPFTPLLMPLRMATGSASVIEIVAALVVMIAFTAVLAVFAARIYTNLVLRRGGRISWLDAIRSTSA